MANEQGTHDKERTLDSLLKIFFFDKMRDLKSHCKSSIIYKSDLANFIWWCKSGESPFQHTATHRDFIPDHLKDINVSAIAENGVGPMKQPAKKAANKLSALLDERRLISGHMFLLGARWHFIYFDNNDHSRRNNHWKGGPHIHLINYLWPDRTAQSVWKEFHDGNPDMKGAIHIRFQQ